MTPASGVSNSETSLNDSVNTSNQLAGFSYDADGRMTSDGVHSFTYDAEGRILTVNGYTYTYDGDGERVEKSNGSTGTLYWPDLYGQSAEETNLSGAGAVRNVYVGSMQVAREDASGNWTYFLHDHLGTPKMVLNASGAVVNDVDYYPFGGVAYSSGSSTNLYGFTGYETESESTSNYAVFRNESPSLGRFMRPDPYDGSYDVTNPQSLNRYAYALNNPVSLVDPYGLSVMVCDNAGNCYTYTDDQWNQLNSEPSGGLTIDANGDVICSDGSLCGSVSYISFDDTAVGVFGSNNTVSVTTGGPKAPNNGKKSAGECAWEAAKDKGVSIGLDILGAIPVFGNGVSAGAGIVRAGIAVNHAITSPAFAVGSGIYGAYGGVTAGPGEAADSLVGSASAGAGIGLALADVSLEGTKAIPIVGNVVSGLTGLYDGYQAYQKYQACMAGH